MQDVAQTLVQGLIFGSIYALGAIGFGLVYNATTIFHVAYAGLANAAAMMAMSFGANQHPWRLFGSVPLTFVLTAILGTIVYLAIYRPMLQRGAQPITVFVASLGVNLVLSAALQLVYGPERQRFSYQAFFNSQTILGTSISYLGITIIATGLVVAIAVISTMRLTLWGKQARAVSSDVNVAEIAGVPSKRVFVVMFALSSVVAAMAGILLGMQTSVTAPVDPTLALLASIAVLLAGKGSYAGAYVGGLLLGLVEAFAGLYLPGQWAQGSIYAFFVVFALIRPQGILGRKGAS